MPRALARAAGLASLAIVALLALPGLASATNCGYVDRTLDTPAHIVDGISFGETTNTIYIPPPDTFTDSTLSDVDINVDITHPDDGDLVISVSHNGKTVTLSNHRGGTTANFRRTVFDDAATGSPISGGSGPFTGSFAPDSALSGFNGMPATGLWTIRVKDTIGTVSGGGGGGTPPPQTLDGWGIRWNAANCRFNDPPCDETGGPVGSGPSDDGSITTTRGVDGDGTITSVALRVTIAHANDADLAIKLKRGSTTRNMATHVDGIGATVADFQRTLFTDAATTPIASGMAPFNGSFQPEQSLNVFNNADASFERWDLTVADDAAGPEGTIVEWGVLVRTNTCVDPDSDFVWSATDNCPSQANSGQDDYDSDAMGDACDPDDDNDTVADGADQCPRSAVIFGPQPADNDADGCRDETEDLDDDNDGVADTADACPLQAAGAGEDSDGDGCGNAIDSDDDGDGVADTADACPTGVVGPGDDPDGNGCKGSEDPDGDGIPESRDRCTLGNPGAGGDTDGDGCKDTEDTDDDDDGVADTADNCPLAKNARQENTDRDAQGDACDLDDDADGLVDTADSCHLIAARSLSGCPAFARKATFKFTSRKKLSGTLSVSGKKKSPACVGKQNVVLFRVKRGKDPAVGKPLKTGATGKFALRKKLTRGKYYAVVSAVTLADVAECGAAKSKVVTRR